MPTAHTQEGEPSHGLLLRNVGEFADADRLVEYAVAADDAGWDGVFFGDHLIYPWVQNPDEYQTAFDP